MMTFENDIIRVAQRWKKVKSLFFLFLILFSVSFLFSCGSKEKTSENPSERLEYRPEVGYLAPDFALEIMGKGKMVNLSDYRGKVVLLNFWASWCFPCRKEMPSMEELYQMFKELDFEILAVNLDKFGREKVSGFVSNYGLTFPILLDKNLKTGLRYGIRSLPATYIIDKKGVIKERIVGGRNWTRPEFVKRIESLMGS